MNYKAKFKGNFLDTLWTVLYRVLTLMLQVPSTTDCFFITLYISSLCNLHKIVISDFKVNCA